jgi:hypothetical protein
VKVPQRQVRSSDVLLQTNDRGGLATRSISACQQFIERQAGLSHPFQRQHESQRPRDPGIEIGEPLLCPNLALRPLAGRSADEQRGGYLLC